MLAFMSDELDPQAEITVVLADDHAVVRKGLRLLLDSRARNACPGGGGNRA